MPSSRLFRCATDFCLGGILSAAETVAAPPPPTLAGLAADIAVLEKAAPGTWTASSIDLDRNGIASRLEVLAGLLGREDWFRRHLPSQFKSVDADHSNTISAEEARAIAARDPDAVFTIAAKPRTLRQRMAGGNPAMAGGPQAGIGGGGGGTSGGISMGGNAWCYFGRQTAYIQDYNVVDGQLDPVIGILSSGVLLEVSDWSLGVVRR
jgi:hypothetical protein